MNPRSCRYIHDGEYPQDPVISFCSKVDCDKRFACGHCQLEYHRDHIDSLISIKKLKSYIQTARRPDNLMTGELETIKQLINQTLNQLCLSFQGGEIIKQENEITEDYLDKFIRGKAQPSNANKQLEILTENLQYIHKILQQSKLLKESLLRDLLLMDKYTSKLILNPDIVVEFEFQMKSQDYCKLTISPDITLQEIKEFFIDLHDLGIGISIGFVYQDTLQTNMKQKICSIICKGDHTFKVLVDSEIKQWQDHRSDLTHVKSMNSHNDKLQFNQKITCINYNTRQIYTLPFHQGMTYSQLYDALVKNTVTSIYIVTSNGNPININASTVLQNQEPIYFIEICLDRTIS